MVLLLLACDFFSRFLLSRNYKIQIVASSADAAADACPPLRLPEVACSGRPGRRHRQVAPIARRRRDGPIHPIKGLLIGRFFPIFTDFSDFLGRLLPSKTAIQKPPDTLGVEESSILVLMLILSTVSFDISVGPLESLEYLRILNNA